MDSQIITDLLRFVWSGAEDFSDKFSAPDGVPVHVEYAGEQNPFPGIDFSHAVVRIGDEVILGGNVKVLNDAAQWKEWERENSEQAQLVSLLVVGRYDGEYVACGAVPMPVVVVNLPEPLETRFVAMATAEGAKCIEYLSRLDRVEREGLLEWFVVDRLQNKCQHVLEAHESCGERNWSHTFTYMLFDTISIAKVNRKRFCRLAREIRYNKITERLGTLEEVEALLFGVSGLLATVTRPDEYTIRLRRIYQRQREEYRLTEMDGNLWSFSAKSKKVSLGLMMARLAAILFENRSIAYKIAEMESLEAIKSNFRKSISPYWLRRYELGGPEDMKEQNNGLSEEKVDVIMINCVIPYLYCFFKEKEVHFDQKSEMLLDFLFEMKGESNVIIDRWKRCNVPVENAASSQAMIQVTKEYCRKHRCSMCRLARQIMY